MFKIPLAELMIVCGIIVMVNLLPTGIDVIYDTSIPIMYEMNELGLIDCNCHHEVRFYAADHDLPMAMFVKGEKHHYYIREPRR